METPITRAEHEEFVKRMEDENRRQNRRIDILEKSVQQFTILTASVEKLASNMESMVREQTAQGERLERLEGRDGEKWKTVTTYALSTIIGLLIGYIFKALGM